MEKDEFLKMRQEAKKDEEDLITGKATLNEIRKKYGLSPIPNGDCHFIVIQNKNSEYKEGKKVPECQEQ